ncbi:SH3 domain-containing protein [Bacillus sp. Marseille-P3661]|uniref:SH3 domain-containing protein n=1 Tax=Bacillus sp. Marseille-P3661 TaxID=1936234 RepID=UPI000C8557A9|nr:SH3 domain-containing protein [Bacillus sp. Marseille-P3661]
MKCLSKSWMATVVAFVILLPVNFNPIHTYAETSIATKCGYVPEQGVNPSPQTINCLLTEVALSYDVPPEIVKAIAEQESGWQHYTSQEVPLISDDGGIGIMQVTLTTGLDVERLESDLLYNIEAGVQNLNNSFARKDLPTINNGSRHIIENWYFAIMAYNGIKPVNSPVYQASGKRNEDAYQEQVMQIIRAKSLLDIAPSSFKSTDFVYNTEDVQNIQFATMFFNLTNGPLHTSKYFFKQNEEVYFNRADVKVRQQPTTSSSIVKTVKQNETGIVTGSFVYDVVNPANHFTWYPVQLSDGTKGYVAGSYLSKSETNAPVTEKWKEWNTAQKVAKDKVWNVELDTEIAASSIQSTNIYIQDSTKKDVAVELSLGADAKKISIKPLQTYVSGQTYTLYIKNIKSVKGKQLKDNVKMDFVVQ